VFFLAIIVKLNSEIQQL